MGNTFEIRGWKKYDNGVYGYVPLGFAENWEEAVSIAKDNELLYGCIKIEWRPKIQGDNDEYVFKPFQPISPVHLADNSTTAPDPSNHQRVGNYHD